MTGLAVWAAMGGAQITSFDPNALYIVVGGGNDLRDARDLFQTNSAADQQGRQDAADAAVGFLINSIQYLAAHGAKNILISNLPDLGLIAASHDASERFNNLIPSLLGLEASFSGIDIDLLDMAGVSANVRANPGAYGNVNAFLPCAGFTGADALVGIGMGPLSCDVSLFSDGLHTLQHAPTRSLRGQPSDPWCPNPTAWRCLAWHWWAWCGHSAASWLPAQSDLAYRRLPVAAADLNNKRATGLPFFYAVTEILSPCNTGKLPKIYRRFIDYSYIKNTGFI